MSRRETQIDGELQQWRGVDQRTSPVLVQEGFFVMSRGVFFGLGENAERIPGKVLAALLEDPVFNLVQFGSKVLIQTMDDLLMCDVSDLMGGDFPPPIVEDFRITEAGDTRITEAGDSRIIE